MNIRDLTVEHTVLDKGKGRIRCLLENDYAVVDWDSGTVSITDTKWLYVREKDMSLKDLLEQLHVKTECANASEDTQQEVEEEDLKQPDYYTSMTLQPIEVMQKTLSPEKLQGFLIGNLQKYIMRLGKKEDALETAQKVKVYATWLCEALEGKELTVKHK